MTQWRKIQQVFKVADYIKMTLGIYIHSTLYKYNRTILNETEK